jgi:hypothetical protein
MPTYTVHEPPLREGDTTADPERFVFVRDGFYFWAFLIAPLWLLVRRLWLVLLLYVVLIAALGGAFFVLQVPPAARFAVTLLLGLLIGFEAATLWRWTLARRGWKAAGIVVADDAESAERRFFDRWAARTNNAPAAAPAEAPVSFPVRRGPPDGSDVIGLFPEPGGPR